MLRRFRRLFIVAKYEFLISLRNKWVFLYGVSYLLLAVSLSPISLAGLNILGLKAVGRILASLINLSLYLIPLVAIMVCSTSIVGDRESYFLEWLMSKPISALEYVVGKYLGLTTVISLSTILGYGLASWMVILFLPPEDISKYFLLMLVALFMNYVFSSIGIFVSTLARSRYIALGYSFSIWFLLVFIYDIMIVNIVLSSQLNPLLTSFLVGLNPVESTRILMIFQLDPNLTFLGFTGIYILRDNIDLIITTYTLILITYIVSFLILSVVKMARSDYTA